MSQSVCGYTDGAGVPASRDILAGGGVRRGLGRTVFRNKEVTRHAA